MNRFSFVFVVLILTGLVSCKPNKSQVNIERPNLLFIFPDQLRNAGIGINNQDPVYTPNIDQLAREGLVVSNAISNYPLCSPYRGMLMTGKLPYNNSILSNSNSKRHKYGNSWQKNDFSFSDVLAHNGYETGYVGKLHLTSPPPLANKDTVIWDAYTPKDQRHGFKFWYSYGTFDQHNKPHYWINDAKENEITYISEWSAKHEADVIIDYLRNPSEKTRKCGKPFALFWSINPPHPPYHYVPEEYTSYYKDKAIEELLLRNNVNLNLNTDSLAFHKGATRNKTYLAKEHANNYFAMITGVDNQIGRVLETLKKTGLDKNTIVVITSDHGEMMGSHGLMSKNIWYNEAVNVPFIIKWPNKIKAGGKNDLFLSVVDVMPTLLNMLGATKRIPKDLDGKDLSSNLLENKKERSQDALYYYINEGNPASGHRGYITRDYTYVVTIDDDKKVRKFLYDNINDPYQLINKYEVNDIIGKEAHVQLLKKLREKQDPWLEYYLNLENVLN